MAPGLAAVSVPAVLRQPPMVSRGSLDPADAGKTVAEFEKDGGEQLAYAEHAQTDANQDGAFDTHEYAVGMLRLKGVQDPVRVGNREVSGDVEFGMANVSAKSSQVTTEQSYSDEASVEGSLYKGSANVSIGDVNSEGRNAALKVGATGQVLHGEIKKKVFVGNDDEKVGFILSAGASAEAAKGEVIAETTSRSIGGYNIQVKTKGGAAAGAIGASGSTLLYWHKIERRLHVGLDAGLKLLLGLEWDGEISIGKEYEKQPPAPAAPAPTPVSFVNTPGFGPGGVPGTILMGNPTVLIG